MCTPYMFSVTKKKVKNPKRSLHILKKYRLCYKSHRTYNTIFSKTYLQEKYIWEERRSAPKTKTKLNSAEYTRLIHLTHIHVYIYIHDDKRTPITHKGVCMCMCGYLYVCVWPKTCSVCVYVHTACEESIYHEYVYELRINRKQFVCVFI